MDLPTKVYDQSGVKVTFRRMTRGGILKRNLYAQALRAAYPEAEYISPFQDALLAERRRKTEVLRNAVSNVRERVEHEEDSTIPASERTKFETARLLNDAIETVSGLLAYVHGGWSGLPLPFPEPHDQAGVKAVLDWYLADEPDTLALWEEWADLCIALQAPMTSLAERPVATLTEAQKTDPLSVMNAGNFGDG